MNNLKQPSISNATGKTGQAQFCSGFGQYHSVNHPTNPKDYLTISFSDIVPMVRNPPSVVKREGQWVIFSTELSRIHEIQRKHGQFGAAWMDIDENPNTFQHVVVTVKALLPGVKFLAYLTKSATLDNQKCRIIFPYDEPCSGNDHVLVEKIVNDLIEKAGIQPDRKTQAAGQICYLPNRGEKYAFHIELGQALDWKAKFSKELETEKDRIKADENAIDARREESQKKYAARLATGTMSPMDAFNATHPVEEYLEYCGYKKFGNRYLSPNSSSGSPGVSVKDGKWISSHESDRETVGQFGDAWDLYVFHEHQGDLKAALQVAGDQYTTTDGETLNKANQRLYMEQQGATALKACIEGVILPCSIPGQGQSQVVKHEEVALPVIDNAVIRLAKLSQLQYDQARKEEAQALGVRMMVLDQAVKEARKGGGSDADLPFKEVLPWPEKVDPAEILSDVTAVVQRFIVCDKEVPVAVALWCAMTWCLDVIQVCPLAVITAVEKRCGKTQLLTVIGRLVCRPITASSISPAALYRSIDAWKPTLLIDEVDACMKDNEELRGIINSGHTRDSAYVIRSVGDTFTPTKFSTWGPKALSGIGHVADTLMDRAIILELRRKLSHEKVDRLRYSEPGLFENLAAKLARFAIDYSEQVRQARPFLPATLNDRAQDNWEPLLAIATVAGGEWLSIATNAALKISGSDSAAQSVGTELLIDIQEIFECKSSDRISTAELIKSLCADDEKPWSKYNRGFPIKPRQLASRLKGYGIVSKTVRINSLETAKGFEKKQFVEAFSRYIPSPSSVSVTTSQINSHRDLSVTDNSTRSLSVTDTNVHNSLETLGCDLVTDRTPPPALNKRIEVMI